MVKSVVVSSWWVPDQVLGNWHFRFLLFWLLLLWFLLWSLLWCWGNVMNIMVRVDTVSIVVNGVMVVVSVMSIWKSMVQVMVTFMMVVMWSIIVILMSMWVILMSGVWVCVLMLMVLNSVKSVGLDIVEELII